MLVFPHKKYQKSLRKLLRAQKIKITEVDIVVDIICQNKKLPIVYRDHLLLGEYVGYRECHIRADVLLIYKIEKETVVLVLLNIGSHSQLFG